MQSQVVRGTQDYSPEYLSQIRSISNIIRYIATSMGAVEIETPTLEYEDLLLDKYGDEAESKLIYRIKHVKDETKVLKQEAVKDSNKEEVNGDVKLDTNQHRIAMRYDLTVPFTRYIMNNGIESIKKIQIGRVYRRDWPYPSQGRFCEFIQADYDIVGDREPMTAEVEIFKLINLVMERLGISNYVIRVNFRQNLEKIFERVGVNVSKPTYFKSLCTTIDKLDKHDWNFVRRIKNKRPN